MLDFDIIRRTERVEIGDTGFQGKEKPKKRKLYSHPSLATRSDSNVDESSGVLQSLLCMVGAPSAPVFHRFVAAQFPST